MKDSGSIDGGKFYTSLASTCQSPIAIYEPPADLVPLYRRKLLAQVAPGFQNKGIPIWAISLQVCGTLVSFLWVLPLTRELRTSLKTVTQLTLVR